MRGGDDCRRARRDLEDRVGMVARRVGATSSQEVDLASVARVESVDRQAVETRGRGLGYGDRDRSTLTESEIHIEVLIGASYDGVVGERLLVREHDRRACLHAQGVVYAKVGVGTGTAEHAHEPKCAAAQLARAELHDARKLVEAGLALAFRRDTTGLRRLAIDIERGEARGRVDVELNVEHSQLLLLLGRQAHGIVAVLALIRDACRTTGSCDGDRFLGSDE